MACSVSPGGGDASGFLGKRCTIVHGISRPGEGRLGPAQQRMSSDPGEVHVLAST